jgi:hypothetical protein
MQPGSVGEAELSNHNFKFAVFQFQSDLIITEKHQRAASLQYTNFSLKCVF